MLMRVNKLLVGFIVAIIISLCGICAGVAEPQHTGFIAHDVDWLAWHASNVEWHAAAIAASIKYLTTKDVAARYSIDPRSVQRRVKDGLLPPPKYFATRFPRWDIAELDENDRKLASVRVPNVGAIAATKANAAKPKPPAPAEKPAAEKPRPRGGPRKHLAASPENHETVST
jgi:hypothetical protein